VRLASRRLLCGGTGEGARLSTRQISIASRMVILYEQRLDYKRAISQLT
jgi:hypothetical protein